MKLITLTTAAIMLANTATADPLGDLARCIEHSVYTSWGVDKEALVREDPASADKVAYNMAAIAIRVAYAYQEYGFEMTLALMEDVLGQHSQVLSVMGQNCAVAYHLDMENSYD